MKARKFKLLLIFIYCFFSSLNTKIQCMDIEFQCEPSRYEVNRWGCEFRGGKFGVLGSNMPPVFPRMSADDSLAFNVVMITTEKSKVYQEGAAKIEKDFSEVGTGFLMWSHYEAGIPAIFDYYGEKKEPILISCGHCVREFPDPDGFSGEFIKSFSLKVHYVHLRFSNESELDVGNSKLYLVTINLKNINKEVPWIHHNEGKDIFALRLGNILQQGKEYLDNKIGGENYPFIHVIEKYELIKREEISRVGYLSDIVMFGYPYELSASSSLPLARFGHCSTDPKVSMSEDPTKSSSLDFYVDMATIGGSSGSPIWFYFTEITGKQKYPSNGDVDIKIEKKYKFAGMLFKGPEAYEEGRHDIHLGEAANWRSILKMIYDIKQIEMVNDVRSENNG